MKSYRQALFASLLLIGNAFADEPDESGCSFMESMTMNGVPGEFGDVVDHFKDTAYGEKYGAFYSEANKLANRIIAVAQISRAAGAGDTQGVALTGALTAFNELMATEAAAAYIKQMAIPGVQSAAVFNTAAFAFQVYMESRSVLAEKTRDTKLESLYGAIEGDKSLYQGAASGRKLGEGDPIPVRRASIEHVWGRVIAESSFRDRFKQYVVGQLNKTFPEPSTWEYFTTVAGGGKGREVSALEQDKLLERRGEVEGWISSLLAELNEHAKANEREVVARKRVLEAAQGLAAAFSNAASQVGQKREKAKQKVQAICKLQRAKPIPAPVISTPSPVPQRAIYATYAQLKPILDKARNDYDQVESALQAETGQIRAALGKALPPITAPRVRSEGILKDNLTNTSRQLWNDWGGLPMHVDDPLMVSSGTPVTHLKARSGEYDRAAGELAEKLSALGNVGAAIEKAKERFAIDLTEARGRLNGIFERYAEYIDVALPYFDESSEETLAWLAAHPDEKMPESLSGYVAARNADMLRWREEADKVDRKRRVVRDLTPNFRLLDEAEIGIPALIEQSIARQEQLERSRQAFNQGIATREERMRAGAAQARILMANYENSAAQLIGAWRGLKRIHSGTFFPVLPANAQEAPRLLEDAIIAHLGTKKKGSERDAERNKLIFDLQQGLAEEDHLVREFIGAQINTGPDANALKSYLRDYTGGLADVMNFGGEEHKADFRSVAGVELRDPYYDIYKSLAGSTLIMTPVQSQKLRSNFALVIESLQAGDFQKSSRHVPAMKAILDKLQADEGRLLGLGAREFSPAYGQYSGAAYAIIQTAEREGDVAKDSPLVQLYYAISTKLNKLSSEYFERLSVSTAQSSLHGSIDSINTFLADPEARGGWAAAQQWADSIGYTKGAVDASVRDHPSIRPLLVQLDTLKEKLQALASNVDAVTLRRDTLAIEAMYRDFASAYESKNLPALTRFLAREWQAADGSDGRDLETTLGNSFRVFDSILFKISGMSIHRVANFYQVSYQATLNGRINRLQKSHDESSGIVDSVVITADGPRIMKTTGMLH